MFEIFSVIQAEQKLKSPMGAPSNSKLGMEDDGIEMGNWNRSPAPNSSCVNQAMAPAVGGW